jgi:signal transduction histidine kinase
VARKLARLLEGTLEVESEVGAGSRFTLTLPRRTPGTGRAT